MGSHLLKISRLEGLTDGIFAIAMTIIVLNLRVPDQFPIDGALFMQSEIYLTLFIYMGSFIILGTHWIAMNFQWGLLDRLNRIYLWTNLFYLMIICVIPFSANLLGKYPSKIDSIKFYAINLLCASLGQLLILECAVFFKLFKKDRYSADIHRAALLRILVAPFFYVSSLIVSPWSTLAAFILLVAPTLIYMIPGRIDRYEG